MATRGYDDLGPLPKVHPRAEIVMAAKADFARKFSELICTHELTTAELLYILNETALHFLGQAVRKEREPKEEP